MDSDSRTRSLSQDPVHIIADGILCRLHVWSEEQWEALPDDRRPMAFVHAPGLGWVGAVPVPVTPALLSDPVTPDRRRADRTALTPSGKTFRRSDDGRVSERCSAQRLAKGLVRGRK